MSHNEKSVGGRPVSGHAAQTDTSDPVESTGSGSLISNDVLSRPAELQRMLDCIRVATLGLRSIIARESEEDVPRDDVLATLALIDHARAQADDIVDGLNVVGAR